MKAKKLSFSVLLSILFVVFLAILSTTPISATDETNMSESVTSMTDVSSNANADTQVLPNGVYRIYNWSTLENLSVENYGIDNYTNVYCKYDTMYDYDEINEKNSLWLLTHLGNDMYTLRPIHKPNMALDYSSNNVTIYRSGISYSSYLASTKWKITLASNGISYIIQNQGMESRTLALEPISNNVYTVDEYSGASLERWGLIQLSDDEVEDLEGIIFYGDSAVQVGTTSQLTAGVFSTSTLNQSASFNCNYSAATVTSGGSITGNSIGKVTVTATSTVDSTVSGSAYISIVQYSRRHATLIGIPSSSGGTHDHTLPFLKLYTKIGSIYGDTTTISQVTSISDEDYAFGYFCNSDVIVFRGHGTRSLIYFGDSAMYSPCLSMSSFGTGEMRIFSDSDLIVYCCCSCGEGGKTGRNLVVATYEKGAKNVIGFTNAINCSEANTWVSALFTRLAYYGEINSDTISSALNYINNTYNFDTISQQTTLFIYQQ
ncbi:MAG: Ig-like domain-containing protein [Eubacteriales bacterium]